MSSETERKYIKTKFEGVFFRQSVKRDPRTGEYDKNLLLLVRRPRWQRPLENRRQAQQGHPSGCGQKGAGKVEFTGVNPIKRDKVTIGDLVDAYLEWDRSEGKYVDQ